MAISIASVVTFVLWILGAGLIFGLLMYLIDYVSSNFPTMSPFARFAKIGLMILAILILISVVLQFMGFPIVQLR